MLVTVLLFFQSITLFLFINFEYSVLVRTVFAVLIIQYWTSCRGGGQKTSTNQTVRLLWHRLVISFFRGKRTWGPLWGKRVRLLKFWFQIVWFSKVISNSCSAFFFLSLFLHFLFSLCFLIFSFFLSFFTFSIFLTFFVGVCLCLKVQIFFCKAGGFLRISKISQEQFFLAVLFYK